MLAFYLTLIKNENEKDIFCRLYERYKSMMYEICFAILRNHADAEDALHDAFLKLAVHISKISDASCSKTRSFLVIVSRSAAIDLYRKKQKLSAEVSFEDIDSLDAGLSQGILERVVSDEGYQTLLRALNGMDSIYKDALKLKLIYGFTDAEIAVSQNIPIKTVNSRIYRGKKALKECLEKEDDYGKL